MFLEKSKAHVSRVQLWRSILSSRRMQVLSKDAGLVVLGENSKTHVSRVQVWRSILSSHRMNVLSKDASLVEGCKSCRRMQVLS